MATKKNARRLRRRSKPVVEFPVRVSATIDAGDISANLDATVRVSGRMLEAFRDVVITAIAERAKPKPASS